MYVCILNKRDACSGTQKEQNALSEIEAVPWREKGRKRIERSAAYEKGRGGERREARSSITEASEEKPESKRDRRRGTIIQIFEEVKKHPLCLLWAVCY